MRERLVTEALRRLHSLKDWTIDECTCADDDLNGGCWYRLTDEERERLVCGEIVDAVLAEIKMEGVAA